MGSQLIKGYTIEKDSKGSVGANGNWKLHDATKQGSNDPASVLIIEKKSLPKGQKEQILRICKKQATSLVKFKHPNIISITQALLEDEHSMGFVVERIQGNIKTLVQSGKFIQYCSSELQLKIHILQLLEALNFLHNSVKLVHLGINLNNIYITPDGKWKLGGFVYLADLINEGLTDCENKPNDFSYMAPEVAIQSKCTYASDTFSLITLALTLLEHIKKSSKSFTLLINASNKNQYEKHKQIFSRIDKHPFISASQTPNDLARLASDSLTWEWQRRKQLSQIPNCEWLTDSFTITIKHLSSIINLQQKMQLEFLKGLSAMVLKFQPAIIKKRIIPTLLQLLKFDYLVAGIVLTLVEILKKEIVTVPQFQKSIWIPLKNLTQGKEISAHALFLFVSNIEIFAKYISAQDLNTTIIPLYIKCFDCPNKLKELALRKVQFLSKKLEYQFIKSKILPKILSLFLDKTLQIRRMALICIYKSSSSFDPQVVTDQILPALDKLRKAGSDGFSNAITLRLYSVFSLNLSIEIIGNKIIPSLVPYLVDSGISNTDFELYKNTINNLMAKIQNQRSKNPNAAEGPVYTQADFDFPQEEKQKQVIKQVQPNFDFLSMFKQQETQPTQSVQRNQANTNQDFSLGFGTGGMDFSGFNTPSTTNNNNFNNLTVSEPINTFNYANGFGGSSQLQPTQPIIQPVVQQPKLQLPNTQGKSLDAAADEFFGFLEDKPAPVVQKPKVVLKGPPSQKLSVQVPSPKKNTIPPPPATTPTNQGLYNFTGNTNTNININTNTNSNNLNSLNNLNNMNSFNNLNSFNNFNSNTKQDNPFAELEKQMNDFGDFSEAPSNTLNIVPPQSNNFNLNLNSFQPNPQNNLNLNFLNSGPTNKPSLSKPPANLTKNVNQISGDSFFDLL